MHVPLSLPSFDVDWQRVKAAMTPRTRMIVINSPHNPSGAVLERSDLDALAEILRGTDVLVLSDEVYEHIIFDGREHQSVLRHPELAERSFVVSSFGKTYHCTGWKVGYCIAPPALSAEFRKVHQYLTFATFTAAQYAFADVLESSTRSTISTCRRFTPRVAIDSASCSTARASSCCRLAAPTSRLPTTAPSPIATTSRSANGLCATKAWQVCRCRSSTTSRHPELKLVRFCFAKTEATLVAAGERLRAV